MAQEVKPVNLPAAMPDTRVSFIPRDVEQTQQAQPTQDFHQVFESLINQAAPKTGTALPVISTSGIDTSGRYPKFYTGLDNESLYAANQGFLEKGFNGVTKLAGVAGATFINGTVGIVNGLNEWRKSGKFNSFYNNDLSNSLNDFTESLNDKYAFYKTERQRNGEWWEPENLISGNMLFDNIIGNMGFMVGAGAAGILTGGLFSAALKGLGSAAGLISTGAEGAAAADAIIGEATALSTAESLGAASTRLQSAWNSAKAKIGQGILNSDRAIKSIAATAGEAGLEALNNSREFRQKMISDYTSKYGTAPTGKDLQDINRYSESVGNASFFLNTAVLGISNYVMLPKVFSSSFKSEKTLLSGIGKDVAGDYISTIPTKGIGKLAYGTYKGLGTFFARSEALEEGAQYAVQTGTQNYFGRKVRNQDADIVTDMLGFGIKETLTSSEGLLNMFIGGVSGGLVTAGMVSRGADGKVGFFKGGTVGQRGFFGFGGEEARIREEALPALTATRIKNKLMAANSNIAIGAEIQEERKQKIAEGNVFEAKNLETDYNHAFIDTRIKYGAEELIYDEINDLRQQANTDFVALQKEGVAAPLDTKESFLRRLDTIEAQAKLTETLNKELTVKYGTIIGDDGKRKYSDQTIDMLTYAMVKVNDFTNRMNQMSTELAKNDVFPNKMVDALISGDDAALKESYTELDAKIAELGKTKPISEIGEIVELLKDTRNAARARKAYLDEYNKIFETPEDFTTQEEEDAAASELTPEEAAKKEAAKKPSVKLKTADGDEDLEIGTEYFTGVANQKTTSGKAIIDFPRFTILGENEDGTIRVRNDENGFIKNYDKSAFNQFKIGKVADAKNNRKASFYMQNVNTVYEMNFGKDPKTGESRKKRGRLTYSPKDGILLFNYINDWGKPATIEVKNTHFVAQGDYKQPMLKAVGTLTADQQKALDDFINDKTPDPRVLEKVRTLAGTLELIFEETMETLEDTKRNIETKTEQLAKVEEELNKLTAKVEGPDTLTNKTKRFKAATHRTIQAISNLTKLRDSLKNDLALLEAEQSELELRLEDVLNTAADLENYPGDYKEFYETVKQQRNNLEDAIVETGLQINKLSDLIDLVEDGLEKAYKAAKALIDKFFDKYPNVPLDRIGIIDFLNRNIEANKAEKEEMQRTTSYAEAEKILPYTAVAGNLLEDIHKLDADLAQIDEIDVVPNEPIIAGLRDELRELNAQLKQYEQQLSAKEGTLKRLDELYKLHKQEREKMEAEELEAARNTEAFKEEFLGTADTSVPSVNYDSSYEPDPKKDWMDVLRATTAPTRKFAKEPLREHHLRANKFGINLESFDNRKAGKIRGVFVTQANEAELGLDGLMVHLAGDSGVDPSKTVALVMVQQNTDGSISLVGVDGKVIESENSEELINQAIYQTMPDPKLRWSNDESMFRDDVPETTQEYYREVYKKKIQDVLDNPSLQTYDVTPSFGTPDITEYPDQVDSKGNPKKNYGATNSVQEAGLITVNDEKDDLIEEQLIKVPTSSERVTKGSTSFSNALGRIFLELPNAYVKLRNGNITEAQANAIYAAVLRLSIIGNKIKGNEEATELINWLRTVIYWGTPKDRTTGEAKKLSYNSLFFDSTDEGFMLFISGKGASVPFTPSSIRANKANIISTLQSMYHNVNSARVNGSDWKKPYTEILSVSEKGERQERKWQNYQTYLLSSEGRRPNEIPLTTNIRPLDGPNDTNRSGVYFVANTNLDAYSQAPQAKEPVKQGRVLGANQPAAQPTAATPAAAATSAQQEFELDGLTENKLSILNGAVTVSFFADKDNFYSPDGGYNLMGFEIPGEAIPLLEERFNTKDPNVIQSKVSAFIIKTIKPQVDAYLASKEAPSVEELEEVVTPTTSKADIERRRREDGNSPVRQSVKYKLQNKIGGIDNPTPQNEIPTLSDAIKIAGSELSSPIKINEGEITHVVFDQGESNFRFTYKGIDFAAFYTQSAKGILRWDITKLNSNTGTYQSVSLDELENINNKYGSQRDLLISLGAKDLVEDIENFEKVEYSKEDKSSGNGIIPLENTVSAEQIKLGKKYGVTYTLEDFLKEYDAELAALEKPVAAAAPVSTESVDYVKAANIENRRKRDLAKPIEEVTDDNNPYFEKGTWITSGGEFSGSTKQEVIDKINAKHDAAIAALGKPVETFVEPESTIDDPTIDTISQMDNINPNDAPAEEYRIANENYTKEKIAREDWPKFEAWLKQNFPNIPVYRVKNMIQASNGRQAWGMFKNGAIYITENALVGTGYHEVFEAIWKALTPIEEQFAVLNEMKSRQGEFFDEMSYKMVKYSAATDKQLKEKLADEFAEFIQTGKKPEAPASTKSFIRQLFDDIINFFKEFFTGEKAMSNTEKLFSKIGNGYYAQYNPYESRLSFAKEGVIDIEDAFGDQSSEYRLAGFTDIQWNDLMQSMTYLTMSELIVNKKSIFEVTNLNKDNLYARIKGNIGYRLSLARKQLLDDKAAGKKTAQEIASSVKGYEVLYQNIMNNWNSIVSAHEEYILPYQIDFDENDNVLLRNEENTGREDYLDATKIDSFKKANAALKLFLASLPEVDTNGNVILSTVSGERLIPVSKVEMTLRNTISNSRTPDEMIGKLKTLADNDASYKLLYKRITYDISNFNLSKMSSDHHMQLISALWKTFKKTAPDVKYVYILTNGDVVIDGSNFTKASDQAFQDLESDMIMFVKDPKSPYFEYNKEQNAYVGKPKGLGAKPQTLEESVKFLSNIGINFTVSEILGKPQFRDQFDDAVGGIYDSIKGAKKIASLSSNTLDIRGRLRELAQIKAVITNPEFDSTFYNINGELTQSFIGTNVHSDLYDYISQINNLSELENTSFSYLMTGADAFTQNSVKISELFNRKTGRVISDRKDSGLLKNGWVDGVYNALKNNRTQSSRLNYRNRLVQQLNLMIKGYYANLVPGDSGLDHMTNMGNSVDFKDTYGNQMEQIREIFKGYFIDELNVSRERRPIVAPKDSGRLTTDLRFFKNILENYEKGLHDEIVLGKVNKDKSVAEVYEAYKGKINNAVEKYLNKNKDSYIRTLNNFGLITNKATEQEEEDDTMGIENVAIGNDLTANELQTRLFGIVANFAINNIEFHKLVYGDPYRFKDMLKRAKNFNSPHQAIIYGSTNFNIAADKVYNKNYNTRDENGNYTDIAHTDFSRDGLISATLEDIEAIADHDGYRELWEEGDGGGIITLKGVRQMRINASEWTPADEKQFVYEVAYEKADKNLPMSPEESIALANGNPQVQSAFTPRKPIGVGNLGDKTWNNPFLDKFALYPISYRMAKEMGVKSEDNNLVKLYNRMQASGVDYVVFKSARKVGSDVVHPVYDAKTGEFIMDSFGTLENGGIHKIPFAILSGQSEVPTKESSTVTTGSQPTKLMTLDLMDAGVPLDFEEDKEFDERYKMWNELPSEEAKIDASKLYAEIKNNQSLIEAMIISGMEDAMNILGIAKQDNKFVIRDLSKAGSTLRSEILKREVNGNIIKSLDGFLKGEAVIEATPAYQQIRNILYSIADKNIISRTMTGGQKVQIPSSFLEANRIGKELINGKEGYTSKDLRFYWDLDEDGNRIKVAEVMVRRWFDNDITRKMSDEQLRDYLNTTPEGQSLLKGIAFRIPTQKQNSIDVFRIAKFLPKEFGDAVVIPSALVKKVGSDFDIDKLFMYFKNVVFDNKGLPTPVKYLDYNNSSREERYYNWVLEKADKDISKYIRFLSKAEVKKLRDAFKQQNAEISQTYRETVEQSSAAKYDDLLDTFASIKKNALTDQDTVMKELFSVGAKLYSKLDQTVKDKFFELKNEMRIRNINGPEEIRRYLALATILLEDEELVSDKDAKRLESMIKIYNQELQVLGATKEEINKANEEALAAFRKDKSATIEFIGQKVAEFRLNEVLPQQQELSAAKKLEIASEIAEASQIDSFDKFIRRPIMLQNTKAALQNAYITSSENLVTSDYNFDQLVKPNSAKQLKQLSIDLDKDLGIEPFDYSSTDITLRPEVMARLRYGYQAGKSVIGIAAQAQTLHSLLQRSAFVIDPANRKYLSEEDKAWLGDLQIKFSSFNKVGGKASLSGRKTADGKQFISDTNGMFIDGSADITKDDWLIRLGVTPNVAATYLFLVHLGVNIDDIAYFMKQPIIRDYLRMIENKGYSYLFIDSYVDELVNSPTYRSTSSATVTQIPEFSKLRSVIKKDVKDLTEDEKREQQFMLNEFLKYAKMAEQLFFVSQGTNFDTANLNDPFLIFKKQEQLARAKRTIFSDVTTFMESSFLNALSDASGDMRNGISNFLVADQGEIRNTIQTVLSKFINKNDHEFLKIAQTTVSNLFDWAVQNDLALNARIEEILISQTGTAKQVNDFLQSITEGHPLYGNYIVDVLSVRPAQKPGQANNMFIKNKANKVYDQNRTIYAFDELRSYLESQGRGKLYDDLVKLSVLQSGLRNSSVSFTSLLPYEDFVKIYGETLSYISEFTNLDVFTALNVVARSNWNNTEIVPSIKAPWIKTKKGKMLYNPGLSSAKFSFIPGNVRQSIVNGSLPLILQLSIKGVHSDADVISYSWEEGTTKQKKEMRKNNDYSYIKRALFQKVYTGNTPLTTIYTNKEGVSYESFVYKAINAWGQGVLGNEFYMAGIPSKFNNGYIKVEQEKRIVPITDESGRQLGDRTMERFYSGEVKDDPIVSLYSGLGLDTTPTPVEISETTPTEQPVSTDVKGNIVLNIIEQWVQEGKATTTVRNNSYHQSFYKGDGIYSTDGGNLVNITHRGLVKIQGNNIVGNGFSYTKDEFAKAEGFGTWSNFEKSAKYAGKTLMGGGSVHLYDIAPATQPVATIDNITKGSRVRYIGETDSQLNKGQFGTVEGSAYNKGFVDVVFDNDDVIYEVNINELELLPVATAQADEILFEEEPTAGYRNRTIKNASADATIAIAYDFNSAGEKLTKSSVLSQGKKYLPVSTDVFASKNDVASAAGKIAQELNKLPNNEITLNIAGNGIYTLKGTMTQSAADNFTLELLEEVQKRLNPEKKIVSIRTGGQTGFDEAGAKAGIELGIPTTVLAPKGWTFRNISGQDISNEQQFKARFVKPSEDKDWTKVNNTSENPFEC